MWGVYSLLWYTVYDFKYSYQIQIIFQQITLIYHYRPIERMPVKKNTNKKNMHVFGAIDEGTETLLTFLFWSNWNLEFVLNRWIYIITSKKYFVIKGFQTIVFIFIVISTMFRPIRLPAFFRYLSNSGTYMELRTMSFIESAEVTCSDSISHIWVQVLSIPVLLLTCSHDWTCNH